MHRNSTQTPTALSTVTRPKPLTFSIIKMIARMRPQPMPGTQMPLPAIILN